MFVAQTTDDEIALRCINWTQKSVSFGWNIFEFCYVSIDSFNFMATKKQPKCRYEKPHHLNTKRNWAFENSHSIQLLGGRGIENPSVISIFFYEKHVPNKIYDVYFNVTMTLLRNEKFIISLVLFQEHSLIFIWQRKWLHHTRSIPWFHFIAM